MNKSPCRLLRLHELDSILAGAPCLSLGAISWILLVPVGGGFEVGLRRSLEAERASTDPNKKAPQVRLAVLLTCSAS